MFQLKRMNFGFVRHTFRTNDGIEHVKTTYFIIFLTGNVRLHCLSLESWIFITRSIPAELKLLFLNSKLSVCDNQLFINWYGKPIGSLPRTESISVLHVTLYKFKSTLFRSSLRFFIACSNLVTWHWVTQRWTPSWIFRLLFLETWARAVSADISKGQSAL